MNGSIDFFAIKCEKKQKRTDKVVLIMAMISDWCHEETEQFCLDSFQFKPII